MKRHTLTILTSLLLLTTSASFAAAGERECKVDTDCNGSRICAEVIPDCANPPPCSDQDLEEDGTCAQTECDKAPTLRCVYPAFTVCASTTDCNSGYACVEQSAVKCNPKPTGGKSCESITQQICVPPYMAPCTDDDSCGSPGFTCKDVPYFCACSPPGDPADASDQDIEECTCPDPNVIKRSCRLNNKSCNFDTDCKDDLVCILPSLHTPELPMVGHCAPADYSYWITGGQDTRDYERPARPIKDEPATPDRDHISDEDTGPDTPGSRRRDAGGTAQDDSRSDFDVKRIDKSDGCHIASLNTGKTSTTALLLAGAAAFFTFNRRRKR